MRPAVRIGALAVAACALGAPAAFAQASFEATIKDLSSADKGARLHAVRLLKDAAYPEAAVPLAALVTDTDDVIQLEAIAAELNIFLAKRVETRRHVGYVLEVRSKLGAEAAFAAGPLALGPRRVPLDVADALGRATGDDNPQIAVEALYALGALGGEVPAAGRRALLRASGPELAATIGVPDAARRLAAVRALGRLFAARPGDAPIESPVGDAVILALNDRSRDVAVAAMEALGAMRYARAVEALTELFQYYKHGDQAAAALDALARIANPASAPLFASSLADKDAAVRAAAVDGLARLGDARGLTAIQTAVSASRDAGVQVAGLFAAVRLAQAPIDELVDALKDGKTRPRAFDDLVEIARARPDALARAARDPDARLRADAADVMGLSYNPAALPLVDPLTRDTDAAVAQAAARAAARLR